MLLIFELLRKQSEAVLPKLARLQTSALVESKFSQNFTVLLSELRQMVELHN